MFCVNCPACIRNSINVSDWTCEDWPKTCPMSGVQGYERCSVVQERHDNKCKGIETKQSEVKND